VSSSSFYFILFFYFNCQVELELGLNTRSKNYYQPRGEQIALDVNGTNSQDEEQYYERYCFLKLVKVYHLAIDV